MKVNLTTLGCPKNIVDSEFLLGGLRDAGVELVENPLEAETIILNTCGFIQAAKEESVEAILQAVQLKKQGRCQRVFVTGCLSQRYHHELKKEIPEVDGYFGNRDMRKVLKDLVLQLGLKYEHLGERLLTTPAHYAYLKISEGCENPCTFCAIPSIRGKFNSRPIEKLVQEAQTLVARGVKELILVAQDTTMYGCDLYGKPQLVPLVDTLSNIRGLRWIRLLYTFPAHFTDDLIQIMAEKENICPYLDLPIQHISDRVLKRMARKITRRQIEQLIEKLRTRIPGLAIRTSLIVGFPGETEEDFQELLDFVETFRFERLGIFTYSREENTPAFHFPDQVPEEIKNERWAIINDIQNEISYEKNQSLVGTIKNIIVDHFDESIGNYIGRTEWDCPEIDNTVVIKSSPDLATGNFYNVKIITGSDYELWAEPVS